MRSPVLARSRRRPFHHYDITVLAVLSAVYGASMLAIIAGGALHLGFAIVALLAELLVVLALDWRGVLYLRGRLSQERIGCLAQLVLLVIIFTFYVFWLGPYLVTAALDRARSGRRLSADRPRRIAELEGQLGLLPPTDGSCDVCRQPLQLGADYCAYCGSRVGAPLRLCPDCGTRTFPDATWCPDCGSPLGRPELSG